MSQPAPEPAVATRPSTDPLELVVTVDFPTDFLDRVRAVDDRIVIHHHPVSETDLVDDAVPATVLDRAEAMYTSFVLPHPEQAPRLRWAQLDTSGIDHLRGSGLWTSDCTITTLGGVSPRPLAEWILMIILAHAHHLRHTERLAADHTWPDRDYRWHRLMPTDLRRATLGIVGYGRIGAELARLARALGMTVFAVRRSRHDELDDADTSRRFQAAPAVEGVTTYDPSALREVLPRCDYVALTVPLTPDTEGMIGSDELAAMKPGVVLINGSRGGVVDEAALLDALDDDRLDLVASDVFASEPLPADHPFWSHPRMLITPHVAGFAPDYLEVVGELFTTNLRHYLAGEPLINVASRSRGY